MIDAVDGRPRKMFRALLKTISRQMTRNCVYCAFGGSKCESCGGSGKILPQVGDPDFLGNVFTVWLMWMIQVKESGAHHKFMEMWDVLHEWIPTVIAPALQGPWSETDLESVRILVEEVDAEVQGAEPTCQVVPGQALSEDELRQLGVID